MKTLRVGLSGALMVLLLIACGTLMPQSFDTRVAYGNRILTGVVDTTTQALTAGRLSQGDAKSVREIAGQARTLLDTADKLGDVPEGQTQLALAIAILENLQTYLDERGVE